MYTGTIVLVFYLLCVQTVLAKDEHSFSWPETGTNANSSYFVKTIGPFALSAPHRDAVKRAVKAASIYWRSPLPLRVLIRYKKLSSTSRLAKSKVKYVPTPNNPSVLIQRPSYVAATGLRAKPENQYDVEIEVNSDVKWHLSDTAPPENRFDLATVVLQEMYKNFMFSGSLKYEIGVSGETEAWLRDNTPSRFDTFVVNGFGCPLLLHYRSNKAQLGHELDSTTSMYFLNTSFPLSTYYWSMSREESVYASNPLVWAVTSIHPLPGQRSLRPPDEALRMQNIYTDLDVNPPSLVVCAAPTTSATTKLSSNQSRGKKKKSVKRILHVPVWAFGLYCVFALIMLAFCLFCICTMGALAKQKEGSRLGRFLACCCTGIDAAPVHPSEPTQVFNYEKHYSKDSANRTRRPSIGNMRNSLEYVRDRIASGIGITGATAGNGATNENTNGTQPVPTPPPAVAVTVDVESSQPSLTAAAEAVLPNQLQTLES